MIESHPSTQPQRSNSVTVVDTAAPPCGISLDLASFTLCHRTWKSRNDHTDKKAGRVFIGFPTSQTTGLLAHISAPSVIPTVERESIDLNARHVRTWNTEMLRIAGIACRIAYSNEMGDLKAKLSRMSTPQQKNIDKQHIDAVIPSAVHTFHQYTCQESTPSSQVGQIIEEAFWTCTRKASIDVLSSRGVMSSLDVRLATEDLSFVNGIPVMPDELVTQASAFLRKLQEFGLIYEITTKDIKKELERQSLTEDQLTELLKWSAKKLDQHQLDISAIHSLFDGTVATITQAQADSYPGPVLLLGSIDTFPNAAKIPVGLPLPPTTIPFRIVKAIPKGQLEGFGWSEMQIVPWLRYLIEKDGSVLTGDKSLTQSAAFTQQVHPVVSKSWDSLSATSKATVVELLANRAVIPTKLGLRRPGQSYFASVRLFDDLPTVHGLQSVKEKYLATLGVRKTLELSVVFERLMTSESDEQGQKSQWSHVDLIKYLVSVRDDIPSDDIKKLRETPICPAETAVGTKTSKLYCVSELYEPTAALRDLGLRLLYWSEPLRPNSSEAKFLLSFLGLMPYPPPNELVRIMADAVGRNDAKLHGMALHYLISNNYHNNYAKQPLGGTNARFLPLTGAELSQAVSPSECFVNEQCAVLGYAILRKDLHPHASLLGVEQDPPIIACVQKLIARPPLTGADAKTLFGYFAGRLNEIGSNGNLAQKLGDAPIIPITDSGKSVRFVTPRMCFLGDSATYGNIFDFVDFGSDANAFLLKIGSKHEPTAFELAGMLIREPARLLNTLGSEKYLSLLRRLADNTQGLKSDKTLWANMKKYPCLIACREVMTTKPSTPTDDELIVLDDDEESAIKEYSLASASQMVVADDFGSYRLFRDKLMAAPQEEILENFYHALGAPWLSTLIDEDQRMGALLPDQAQAKGLQKLIIERSRLFLHDHAPDAIRHDARWLEKALDVQVVSSLTMRKTLKGYNVTHTEKRTAALHRESKTTATLYVTTKADLFEVSRALMSLLLKRPKQQDFLALESVLENDLRRLKIKGYNVDRILRQKAAESRIAETERQRQMEEENKRIAEKEQEWRQTQAAKDRTQEQQVATLPDRQKAMPGSYHDSPEAPTLQSQGLDMLPESVKKSSLFSKLSKQLGMQPNPQRTTTAPTLEASGQRALEDKSGTGAGSGTKVIRPDEQVTAPHELTQNLMSAVQASRAHNSSSIFDPPVTKDIKEDKSYCDSTPEHNLRFLADSRAGVKIFVDTNMAAESNTAFLEANLNAINAFASLLLDCGEVFLVQPSSLHIYYNKTGPSIAFNTNGSLFFNLRYFLQLHWGKWTAPAAAGKVDAAVYWWVTMCHELAHNIVKDHSAAHEYYAECFVIEYFSKIMARALQYGGGQHASPQQIEARKV